MTHAITVETLSPDVARTVAYLGGATLGNYRWRCSCGKTGLWQSRAWSARTGGQRHVAMMERSKP